MNVNEQKKIIKQMTEEQFRIEILIPLFIKMGFKQVVDYHGGPIEQGKDILFWKEDEFNCRQYFGVVVKTGDITGSVSDKERGMPTYLYQLEQAITSSFDDKVDGRTHEITRMILATNGTIGKEAINSICGKFKKLNLDKIITFISIENIIDLINQYMPTYFEKDQSPNKELGETAIKAICQMKLEHPEYKFPTYANKIFKIISTSGGYSDYLGVANATYPYAVSASGDANLSLDSYKKFFNKDKEKDIEG